MIVMVSIFTIMLATSSFQPPIIKWLGREEFGNAWIHGWKHSRARNHVFLQVMCLLGLPMYRVSVSAVSRLDLAKLSTKSARDCSENSICSSACWKTVAFWSSFGRWCWQNVHVSSESSICTSKSHTIEGIGAVMEDYVGKMCAPCSESSVCAFRIEAIALHFNIAKIPREALLEDEVGKIHLFITSLVHWFSDSLTHWIVEPLIQLIHWCIDPLVHWLIESLAHWTVESLIHWFLESVIHRLFDSLIHWFFCSLIHWFMISLMNHWWFIGSINLRIIDSLVHCFIDSVIHRLVAP